MRRAASRGALVKACGVEAAVLQRDRSEAAPTGRWTEVVHAEEFVSVRARAHRELAYSTLPGQYRPAVRPPMREAER